MGTNPDFIKFIADHIQHIGKVTYKKLFGEYALYFNGKLVALVCDDQLFVKPTQAGRQFIGNVVEAPPYPGAKPYFLIQDEIENREWLRQLIQLTEGEVPLPKPKKTKI